MTAVLNNFKSHKGLGVLALLVTVLSRGWKLKQRVPASLIGPLSMLPPKPSFPQKGGAQ